MDVADRRFAFRAEARQQHRHSGADVGALHSLAVEPRRSRHHHAVRIAENDPCTHGHELVDEEQAALEHLFEDKDLSAGLRRDDDCDRRQVGRECRPRSIFELRDITA